MQVQTASGIGGVSDGDLGALRRGKLIRVYGLERVFIDLFDDIVHATGVTAGHHPLGSFESMAGATIVVRQRAECGDRRATQHEFVTVERVGDQAALGARKKNLSSGTLNTRIPTANSDDAVRRQDRIFGCLRSGHNSLAEGEFVPGRSPIGRLGEALGHFKHQLIGIGAIEIHRPFDIERAC